MLASPPQIFWFQQQKYALLKSRLFLYSGEINTRINYCISNDDITDQNPNEGANQAVKPVALIVRCLLTVVSVVTRQFGSLSIYLFMLIKNSLASTVFSTPKTWYITALLASLHWLKVKERIEYKLLLLHTTFFTARCYASAVYAVMQCLSVRPSVTFVDHVKTNKHIFEIFPPLGSDTILVFTYQRGCRHSGGVE